MNHRAFKFRELASELAHEERWNKDRLFQLERKRLAFDLTEQEQQELKTLKKLYK